MLALEVRMQSGIGKQDPGASGSSGGHLVESEALGLTSRTPFVRGRSGEGW
jgi:hypothetical protein